MKRLLIHSLCLTLALLAWGCTDRRPADRRALRLLCGAGLQPALGELLAAYTEESGIPIEPDYAGSGIILTRAQQPGIADLFLPGDVFYVEELQRLTGRVAERVEVAVLRPCIIVAQGNPLKITSLQDFGRRDVRVAVGNAEACQVGRLTAQLLAKAGVDTAAITAKESLTVGELGLWVKLHDVDAAVVWDATAAALGPAVEVVPLHSDPAAISRVALALLSDARDATLARGFMRFCLEPRAQGILRRKGYGAVTPAAAPGGGRP